MIPANGVIEIFVAYPDCLDCPREEDILITKFEIVNTEFNHLGMYSFK